MKYCHILFTLVLLLFSFCTEPINPNTPENAKPIIKSIDGRNDTDVFDDGQQVSVDIKLEFESFMDSVDLTLFNPQGSYDTTCRVYHDDIKSTLTFTLNLRAPGERQIIVKSYNQGDITASDTKTIYIRGLPARIVQHPPSSVAALAGDSVVMRAKAQGSIPLSGNWYHNDQIIVGADRDSLILPSVAMSDTGTYRYYVSNPYSEQGDSSTILHLTVSPLEWIRLLDDTVSIMEDSIGVFHVLRNDSFPGDQPLLISNVSAGTLGSVKKGDSTITYTPEDDIWGQDTITYTVSDTISASVFITIQPTQDKPEIYSPDSTTVQEGNQRRLAISAQDPDNESIRIWASSTMEFIQSSQKDDSLILLLQPAAGMLTEPTYEDSITISAADGNDTVKQIIYVKVFKEYRPPSFTTGDSTIEITEGEHDSLKIRAVDYNGYQLSYEIDSLPQWVTYERVNDTLVFTCSPSHDEVPDNKIEITDTFWVSATNQKDTIRKSVIITVRQYVNEPPAFEQPETTIVISENESFDFTAAAIDPDGDTRIDVSIDKQRAWVETAFGTDSLRVTLMPDYDAVSAGLDTLEDTIVIKARDGKDSSFCRIIVKIVNVNRAPV
ncbi:MAG: Ig-like domain-containing protein, partial [Chitinivibrionales bacterium]